MSPNLCREITISFSLLLTNVWQSGQSIRSSIAVSQSDLYLSVSGSSSLRSTRTVSEPRWRDLQTRLGCRAASLVRLQICRRPGEIIDCAVCSFYMIYSLQGRKSQTKTDGFSQDKKKEIDEFLGTLEQVKGAA